MKRFEIVEQYSCFFLLPTIVILHEKKWYMYVGITWGKWSLEYEVFKKES